MCSPEFRARDFDDSKNYQSSKPGEESKIVIFIGDLKTNLARRKKRSSNY
jgi:hypothetical protein